MGANTLGELLASFSLGRSQSEGLAQIGLRSVAKVKFFYSLRFDVFRSFFPYPKWFLLSTIAWCGLAMAVWFGAGFVSWQAGLDWAAQYAPQIIEGERPPFLTAEKIWAYLYIFTVGAMFPLLWAVHGRNGWYRWSVVGTTAIILVTYFNVQISVYMNHWYGGFFDLIQVALTDPGTVLLDDYLAELRTVIPILMVNITVLVLFSFCVKHYLFRWRTAMNNYYMHYWPKLRHVEGSSQRVQEDTQRFARIIESLGVSFVDSIMTLIAFLPLLLQMSEKVTEVPFFGAVDGALVYAAVFSALFGTVVLAVVGIKLPGLEFNNQKVEAAYRKELVYGEDDAALAQPPKVSELYEGVRQNYFRLYFHYLYFGIARYAYLQGSNFIPYILLGSTVVAGTITFGVFQQILRAFGQVEDSLKFLANSWTTIIDLLSIRKRLAAFESHIKGAPIPPRQEWITDFNR